VRGLMMDMPLLVSGPLEHAARYHGSTEIVARTAEGGIHRYTYAEAHSRAKRLANALRRLGVKPGDRVASLSWNTHRHFEMFFGVPGSGAVLNTVNPRFSPDQLAYVVNHADDSLLFVDAATLPLLEQFRDRLTTVKGVVVMTDTASMPRGASAKQLICYEELLAAESDRYDWPEFDERDACTICYTSGTTGNPKGVVYSHRAMVLVTLLYVSYLSPGTRNGALEVLMPMAPMFHVNAWFFPYLAPMTGSKLVLPGRNYEPDKLYELIEGEQVTITCGVPTNWLILTDWLDRTGKKFSKLRLSFSSGSAPPRALVEKLERDYGVELAQSWGMTEAPGGTNALAKPGTADLPFEQRIDRRLKSGRAMYGVKYRLVDDDGRELPENGVAAGHLRVKGPWITAGYFKGGGGSALDDQGWLITGDVATIDPDGHITITDRSKDVIKSGGEWISSLALEAVAASHPAVLHAAVIAVAHPKWLERPLLVVHRRAGSSLDARTILEHMRSRVPKWWMPDDVIFVDEMPMTGTGKIRKVALREKFHDYRLPTAENGRDSDSPA
jgi:acyl-CoA synthetase (AMP-forming)/AMP-acid ligase II